MNLLPFDPVFPLKGYSYRIVYHITATKNKDLKNKNELFNSCLNALFLFLVS